MKPSTESEPQRKRKALQYERKCGKYSEKPKIAWGITGSGDRLEEIVDVMKRAKNSYQDWVDIRVYLSKSGEQVAKWYKLFDRLAQNFQKIYVEAGPNSPFLAGDLQLGRFKFLLIAPATSNTVAKIASGIADSLLTNSAIMALKGLTPVYILPSDYKEGTVETRLPNGKSLKVRVRRKTQRTVKDSLRWTVFQ